MFRGETWAHNSVLAGMIHGLPAFFNSMQDERDEIVATVEFQGSTMRLVYETRDGKQYVIDDFGRRIYGVYYYPREADQPTVIDDQDF